MPYYMQCTSDIKCLVDWRFETDFPMSDYRVFLKGDGFSESEIKKFPKKIIVDNVENLDDLPEVIANGADIGFINKEVKDYIEQNDPGLHKFLPISVQVSGSDHVLEYFFFYSSNKVSSVCYEKTLFKGGKGKDLAKASRYRPQKDIHNKVECYLYKKNVEGCNVWRNPGDENRFVYFCSDEFGEFLMTRNIRGWALAACEWED